MRESTYHEDMFIEICIAWSTKKSKILNLVDLFRIQNLDGSFLTED